MTTEIRTHGSYAYNRHGCRCDVCKAAKAKNSKSHADRVKAAKPPAPAPVAHARQLRIIGRDKPDPVSTFVATPVDDCGEQIGPGRWCTHRLPCPTHTGEEAS